ncbi:acyl-CoA/acyl-ACP dehydrogenase [Rhodococcus sp. BP-349]|uniref:acyl-CoA dehydrogenase family protein n=1 Tax=unclassified Rhodococcus (in: high G+C Gram-positive bacteria) TaxID=192944 RepID=UPI001C9A8080|nr:MULTISPECIES: acyl-CoA dehydrogenase family protein [unclassified Rhodococcus (in: high G+C Gram-positive bacteria)]MBY6537767.1 acyl-CoA/acyl-ACP dehydrogenase [Rhodococcus sp. BP-363]MBY6542104.1 acyl-CoA/acyl-ACP dehydrogenase [Rhodococcus sp. BP-369]MBY6561334.1 acyl-CoA/acyl-ACP dehydrogenase [Rhodococcus sp. BP-370]MBY6575626.1 acyl-CoA/acyl-ACP dehydrogenase [Rhodococcus sp. BP-364]MBY6584927.1 acyl-CoA/acyl-ACP dehydrogenase [Rhodococcus sp. BP-358]
MNLEPTQDQNDLAATVRKFIDAELPLSMLHRPVDAERRRRTWMRTADLGWLALGVPESSGGVGLGLADETFLLEELGRGLVSGPYLPTMLATQLAVANDAADLVEELSSGESRAGLAVVRGDDEPLVVVDGIDTDYLLLWSADAVSLIRTPDDLQDIASLDPGTALGHVRRPESDALLTGDDATVKALHSRAAVLTAAQLAGMLQAMRDMSVGYCKTRTQFGKPIGSFQAVSRRCADMAVRAWSSTSLARMAGLCIDAGRVDGPYVAATAKTVAGTGAAASAKDNIQNLGGIGFTGEHDAHLFYKRVRIVDTVWGDSRHQATQVNDGYPGIVGIGSDHGLSLRGEY